MPTQAPAIRGMLETSAVLGARVSKVKDIRRDLLSH
jgi:hypothetical protein